MPGIDYELLREGWSLYVLNRGVGRYKSFPVEEEDDFYQLVRYVERNALRGGLVERAEAWRWCSLRRRTSGAPEQKQLLSDWPVAYATKWRAGHVE